MELINLKLFQEIDSFYYKLALKNLRAMNKDNLYKNLSYNSLLYLEIILYNKNCTPSFLADTLHVARSAVTVKVNELVAKGLVIKSNSPTDKRVIHLRVSPEVIDDYKEIDKTLIKATREIERNFSDSEVELFIQFLQIISKHYRVAEHEK
ncbi:MarR family transcriptional regulator [Terribacillus aidingensis]|uniref:MarR family winged helix-turn-helix transcriptional regulator n=1 Tax=Terribacillus aidingensis TaxID=586416 RepID=UPI00344EB4AA